MTKAVLNNLVNLENETSAVNIINANNAVIETAFDNTLSRNGLQPNQMENPLDMNNNQILNLPKPSSVNSPARLIDVTSNPTIVIPTTGTSGHTVPYLDTNNTWSGVQTFDNGVAANGIEASIVTAGVSMTTASAAAIPNGGTIGLGLKFSSTPNFGIFFGNGNPTLQATKGSLYIRTDGTTTTNRMYINTDGGTTWTSVVTVA